MSVKHENPKHIRKKILNEMKNGIYANCTKLPRETVLSEELGISRTQLRDALPDLEREGFITRRHGVGTVINRHVLKIMSRMDIECEFLDIIEQNGHKGEISFIEAEEAEADQLIAEKLCIEKGTPILKIRRVCTADGVPAIYNIDILEKKLLKKDYKSDFHPMTIFEFLLEYCDVEAYMDLTQIHPVLADNEISEMLKVKKGTPLLNMEEIDYDIEGKPVFYSRQYFIDDYFEHTVLRKKF